MCFSPAIGIQFVDYCCAGSGEEHKIAPSQVQTDFKGKKKKKKSINIKISLLAKHKVRSEKSSTSQAESGKTFVWLERAFSTLSRTRAAEISDEKSTFQIKTTLKVTPVFAPIKRPALFLAIKSVFLFFFMQMGFCRAVSSIPMFEPVCFPALWQQRAWQYNHPSWCRHILGDTKPITLIYGAFADIYTPAKLA